MVVLAWRGCEVDRMPTNTITDKQYSFKSPCTLMCPQHPPLKPRQGIPSRTIHAAQLSNDRLMHIAVATTVSTDNKQTDWHMLLHLAIACCIIEHHH